MVPGQVNIHTCGRNSKQIVVSMGILPPIPKPLSAVRTSISPYVLGTPRHKPKAQVIKTVPLKAHFRPVKISITLMFAVLEGRQTNNVDKHAPDQSPGCKTSTEGSKYVSKLTITEAEFLL